MTVVCQSRSLFTMTEKEPTQSNEVFSFHLLELPILRLPRFLLSPVGRRPNIGLKHAESFFTMGLGESIRSARRYHLKRVAFFAWWNDETALDRFLDRPESRPWTMGWHVRMRLYRRWGAVSELRDAFVDPALADPDQPIVAVTLARLNIRETRRFIQWGKPVESQVRDHPGKTLALAAMRPLNSFSTFSIWQNEREMIRMVQGQDANRDGSSHRLAMVERQRRDFHHQFTTMRFTPFFEKGAWDGKSNYIRFPSISSGLTH